MCEIDEWLCEDGYIDVPHPVEEFHNHVVEILRRAAEEFSEDFVVYILGDFSGFLKGRSA